LIYKELIILAQQLQSYRRKAGKPTNKNKNRATPKKQPRLKTKIRGS